MNSETNRDQSGESNAGAAKTGYSQDALRQGIRKNASHPGDASNAAGMRHDNQPEQSGDDSESSEDLRPEPMDR